MNWVRSVSTEHGSSRFSTGGAVPVIRYLSSRGIRRGNLFSYCLNTGYCKFASALIRLGSSAELDLQSLYLLFVFGHVLDDLRLATGVHKLPPASAVGASWRRKRSAPPAT